MIPRRRRNCKEFSTTQCVERRSPLGWPDTNLFPSARLDFPVYVYIYYIYIYNIYIYKRAYGLGGFGGPTLPHGGSTSFLALFGRSSCESYFRWARGGVFCGLLRPSRWFWSSKRIQSRVKNAAKTRFPAKVENL